MSDTQLMDVVKNYRQYNYSHGERSLAIGMLANRGITQRRLKVLGVFENKNYSQAEESFKRYKSNSKKALLLYIPTLIIGILTPILNNNLEGFDWLIISLLVVSIVSTLFYIYYLIRSFFNYHTLNEALENKLD